MSKKFILLALAASLLAFPPLAMAQSASDQGSQEQTAQPPQSQGPGNPNAPGGCYNAPQPGQGC